MATKRPIVYQASSGLNEQTDADVLVVGQGMLFAEQVSSLATPANGYGVLYVKTDGQLYFKNDAGTETLIS